MSFNPFGGPAGYPPYPGGTQGGYPGGVPPPAAGGTPPYPAYGQPAPAGVNVNLNQSSGYPPYPGAQSGYPANPQPGYPATPQASYPANPQPGYPANPQPGYPANPQASYPANPQPGYPANPQPGYPANPQPGYPANPQPGYPGNPQPGYPGNPQPSFPPVSQPGYPSGSQPGYPPNSQPGYPPNSQPGYPPATQPGYPPAPQPGYPGQPSGYPGSQPSSNPGSQSYGQPSSYPSGASSSYPGKPSGFPSQPSGFPGQPGGYPAQPGGYPAQPGGYPAQSGGFPAQSGGFPAKPGGFPAQPSGFPSQSGGFSGQQSFSRSSTLGAAPSSGLGAVFQPGNTWYLAKLQGTIRAAPGFDPASDAHALRKAMKGLGTDEKAIINVLCKRSNAQRQQISVQYKSGYGRDLIKDLKSELGGKFENVILGLMMPPFDYLAQQLYKAMDGLGTDEDVLFETLCTHSNAEIRGIRDAYKRLYNRDLERDVTSETSGHFRKIITALLQANRDESGQVDQAKAANQAHALYKAGEKKMGTDEETFNVILVTQNPAQLQAIMAEYEKLSKKGLIKAIESETSGDYRQALMAIVKSSLNRTAYFAERLYDTMKGMGTRDNDLIRLIVCRAEYDLANIKQEFLKLYGKTLEKAVASETSGDYKKALLVIIEGN